MHLEVWTNTFCNFANGKESGSELEIEINPFCTNNLSIWTNTFVNLDKCVHQFGQRHLKDLDKYI